MHAKSIVTSVAVVITMGAVAVGAGTVGQGPETVAQAAQKSHVQKGKKHKAQRMCRYRVPSKQTKRGYRTVKRKCRGKRAPAGPLSVAPGPVQSPPAAPVPRCDRTLGPSDPNAPQKLVDSLTTGQTGCLRGGTYDSSAHYVLRFSRPGVTIRSTPKERARLVGTVYVPKGMDGVTLADLTIEGDNGSVNTVGIYAADVTVEDSTVTNKRRGRSCMMLGNNAGDGQALRTIVRRNEFPDCGDPKNGNLDHAFYLANAADGQITGNRIERPAAYAIQFYPNAQRMLFAGNHVDGTGSVRGGVVFGSDGSYASNGNVVRGNVIVNAATYGITTAWGGRQGTGNVAERNCFAGSRQGDVASQTGFRAMANVSGTGEACRATLAE
jgi:hypothetical protein